LTASPPSSLSAYDAVTGRRSIRRFLPDAVPEDTVKEILRAASRAASGVNMQPWIVHIVTGAARDRVAQAALQAEDEGRAKLEYPYLPETIPEPYRTRRRAVGYALYECYGIARHDMAARRQAMLRNFDFFGAPVGIFLTMDRVMSQGSWLDCGMFMQNIMVIARTFGLETCPQQAWCDVGNVIHQELAIPENHILLSGMALGHADTAAPENRLITDRVPVEQFSTWHHL
jgi:nitroreductase